MTYDEAIQANQTINHATVVRELVKHGVHQDEYQSAFDTARTAAGFSTAALLIWLGY